MRTIKKGEKGDDVKTLQLDLNIEADGIFGGATEAAVKTFQQSRGLVADGIVGPKTWAALCVVDPRVVYSPLGVHVSRCPGRAIKYLAIHYTAGGSSSPGRALAVKSVFESRQASADFAVDDRDMVQFNPDIPNYYCWAVGDKKAAVVKCADGTNRNTISIEVCSTLKSGTAAVPNHAGWTLSEAAVENAARLAKILMKKYAIPLERVVRHYDISGKLCPGVPGWNDGALYSQDGKVTGKKNDSSLWVAFKSRLSSARLTING